jgi:hypothetical protein
VQKVGVKHYACNIVAQKFTILNEAVIFNCTNNLSHRHAAKPKTLILPITQSESRYFAQVEHWGHFPKSINVPKHPNLFALGEKNEQKTLDK